ncbi:hypothetical protein H5410_003097 [Solanum commersonii]|uniref:YTH domain-containing family protein n=1 Tax=Solanum commersonii TaxID=4109 RepID=A0A9J6B424_SOLCO|nr:hypothetical protein H5410_003097 [Solanum commersonii]
MYDSRSIVRGWMAVDNRFKPRGRGNSFYGYGNENMDSLNELNRGPRGKGSKNQKDREEYNCQDFPVTYTDAKFFIIKYYIENDVHKSIKYIIWASTPNGNKKLDVAHHEAQQKVGGCPVFLFFSWIGCFPIKWHIVKDVPNSLLKHITLENNENKHVTNNRDTQEVKMDRGQQLLKIFMDHDRQKRIQEKKAKQQLFQKQSQVWEGKAPDEKKKENSNNELKSQKPSEVTVVLNKESLPPLHTNGQVQFTENVSVTKLVDDVKGTKPVILSDKIHVIANGIANGVANAC